jgi:hypothetical protein
MGVVEDFVRYYRERDWDRLATCFNDHDFERVGPYVDVISSKDEYLNFLQRVVPTMGDDYALIAERVVYVPEQRLAFAQLTEHLRVDGAMTDIPEAIVFDLDNQDRITRMRLYLQQPGGLAPVGGRDAMGTTES